MKLFHPDADLADLTTEAVNRGIDPNHCTIHDYLECVHALNRQTYRYPHPHPPITNYLVSDEERAELIAKMEAEEAANGG